MGTSYYIRFAQAYGEGAYNNCSYNDATTCSSTGGGSTGSNGGGTNGGSLSNTGLMIAIVITIACVTIFVALLVRFWRRSRQQLAPSLVADEDQTNDITSQHNNTPEQQPPRF